MDGANYFAIIPADVRYDRSLSPLEKLLYAEITALSNKEGYCWASNAYFADILDRNQKYISSVINKLAEKGYLHLEYDPYTGGSRKIYIGILKNIQGGPEKPEGGHPEKPEDNNIISSKEKSLITTADIDEVYTQFCGKFVRNSNSYKLSPARRKKISIRLNDAGKDMILMAIDNTAKSAFHRGDNERGWQADLDWILRSYEQTEKLAAMTGEKPKSKTLTPKATPMPVLPDITDEQRAEQREKMDAIRANLARKMSVTR